MFDMRNLEIKYFDVIFPDGQKYQVEPPKLKVLKKILSVANVQEEDVDESLITNLSEAISLALSKNKQKREVSVDFIEENLNIGQMQDLLTAYFEWVEQVERSKN